MKEAEFYINKLKYIEGASNAEIDFIQPVMRRRMSALDRAAAACLFDCFDNNIQNIIFASKTGEVERLISIIEQYMTENAVSPAAFSGSVHNYAAGMFLMNIQKSIPYTALSAGDETFAAGLFAAAVSKYSNVLYVYSDIENEKHVSLCLNISKNKLENSKKFKIELAGFTKTSPALKDYSKLFSDIIKTVKTQNYTVSRGFDD